MQGYFIKKMGENRGKPRIWLENSEVSSAGFKPGDRYDVKLKGGVVTLQANPDGSRVVSKSKRTSRTGEPLPIIDLNSKALLALFEGMESVRLVQRKGEIYLLPLASEVRKKERLNRLNHKLVNGIPLKIGSLSHGVGLLSKAVHEGLRQSGIKTEKGLVNEIRPELLDHASHASEWSESTIQVAAPMQEFAFDEAAMRHVPKHEGIELGLPCSGASVSGRAKRGTEKAEDHPQVGHLFVAALMIIAKANPAFLLFENVVPYSSTASASVLRHQLRDLGYETHETVLKGEDFNALESRKRWCMVAVTKGMHFDWDMLQMPKKRDLTLSEIMDEISPDDPMWSEMRGLKDKEQRDIENGKSFKMQVFQEGSPKITTITKGYAKNRSTDAKIQHPSDPELLRMLTVAEAARAMQWPPSVVEGLSKTIAFEALGQGVQRDPFVAAAKLLGESILDYHHNGEFGARQLVQLVADSIQERACSVVSQVRPAVAGITYEGPVSLSDVGIVIQDVGGGVGILHKASDLRQVALGETLRVRYASKTSAPEIEHLDTPAPRFMPESVGSQHEIREPIQAPDHATQPEHSNQLALFGKAESLVSEPEFERPRPSYGMRM
ncbi:DNA cytosine methyltransferase [Pseudomonas sp. RP23018S]|uniref:DNA cytosine methyltransferase n=1 Tax=Pseudomonas sp. RP23018S TaxID=3096037 RepID=UPI002ACAD76D|nr:DNA cytosine methyltransferase [Pseudomonas sp. RP23018S]MDZ5605300.1 DNA cytosine methyltransferase [Pseudomonas sp. RP23018S]